MADSVYEMMAKIGLDSAGVIAGIAVISKALTGLNLLVGEVGLALKGLGGAIVVVGVVKSLKDIAEAGGLINHQINMMKSIGMTPAEQAAAMSQAYKTTFEVKTTNPEENLKHLQELRYIFGDASSANQYLTALSRINEVIGNIKDKTGHESNKDQIFDLAKSLEIKNLTTDPKEFMAYANAMLQVIQSSGGKITAAEFRSAVQYGRISALGWNKEFIAGALGRMIQEYTASGGGGGGAGGPGNALMSMSAALIQGKMTKAAAFKWEELGFNNPRFVGIDKEHGRELMMTNPYEWVQRFLMPALAAKGITSQNDIISEISQLFGVRTAAGIVANMALGGRFHVPGMNAEGSPNSPFEKDIALRKVAEGETAYDRLIKEDYPMIVRAFDQEWKTLMQTLGSELMKPNGPVIRAMAALVDSFAKINKLFAENPKLLDAFLIGLASLGAAFAAFATTAMLTVLAMFAPGALVLVAIAGLVAALGSLAALNWESVKAAGSVISWFVDTVGLAASMLGMNPSGDSRKKINPNIHPQSFEGNGITGPRALPINFNPGNRQTQVLQPVTLTLNIDGHQMAQAFGVINQNAAIHPTGPPDANSWAYFRAMGNQDTA